MASAEKKVRIRIHKLDNEAKTPSYAHPGDSGVDLYSIRDYILKPLERVLVSTGIRIAVPKGYEAQVRPKSGLALNHGITIANTPGTIDSGYRGEVGVIAINLSNKEYKIEKGKKVAQMVICRVESAEFDEADDLDETSRNHGGFGSTGTD